MNKNLLIRALFLLMGVLCYGAAQAVNIAGTAWVDADNDGIVDAGETGTNFGGTMYVNVVNASGVVIASTQVGPAGGYAFTGLPNNLTGHKLVLTNTATNPKGNRAPGTYYVAEDVVGGSNTANQANAPLIGEIALTNQAANMQNQNFRMGQQTAFGCLDGIAYQIAILAGDTESSLLSYNVSSGVRTPIGGVTPYAMNSLIYSTATDNFLWATLNASNDIVRIGAGAGTVVYDIANLPVGSNNVGVELPNAYMLIYTSNASEFYVVDVDPSRPTFLELVDPTNGYALKTGPNYGTTVSAGFNSSDMAFLTATGLGYGITPTSNITTLNPATGVVTTNATPVAGLPNANYGGLFSDKAGKLYAFNNATGGFYRVDPVANTATLLSTSPASGGNDAASCPNAFVECDTDIPVVPADVTLCPGNSTNFTVAPRRQWAVHLPMAAKHQWRRQLGQFADYPIHRAEWQLFRRRYRHPHSHTIDSCLEQFPVPLRDHEQPLYNTVVICHDECIRGTGSADTGSRHRRTDMPGRHLRPEPVGRRPCPRWQHIALLHFVHTFTRDARG